MIYTLISDLNYSESDYKTYIASSPDKAYLSNEEINEKKTTNKRDCRILRQPLSLLPPEIEKLIDNTKNPLAQAERRLAYTTLLCGVSTFFGIEDCTVGKTLDGKPYLIIGDNSSYNDILENYCSDYSTDSSPDISCTKNTNIKYQKNEDLVTEKHQHQKNTDFYSDASLKIITGNDNLDLYISISHSDGVIAVCISDEGDVGVDIQSEITPQKAERLNKRFFSDLQVKNDSLNVSYYYCHFSGDEALFTRLSLANADRNIFTSKWVYAESVLKLHGKGFGDLKRLGELSASASADIKSYQGIKNYSISTSTYSHKNDFKNV